ncbi:MAG: LptF/LptG family permease [Bacteroides sp.]|nr:LptF/LptG family permease [Prevotella sp.]MCM1407959.1 LptF/LptG family permease [Treponema brennaborense]MCM1469701.1 LptF/LptG family permease [Bacteroides sp.]
MKNKIFLRYLLRELLLYFFVAFLFFVIVFFVNQILLLAEQVLKQRVPVAKVLRLILYAMPGILAQSSPFATLVGFLMCIGRLVTDNEILISRATGSSFSFILIPVLVLGAVISFASFAVNDYLLPVGTLAMNKLKKEIVLSDPGVELESNSIKRTQDSTLVIGTVTDSTVSDLILFDSDEQKNQRIIIAGKTNIIETKDPSVLMQLKMSEPQICVFDKDDKTTYDSIAAESVLMNVFSKTLFPDSPAGISPREMTAYDVGRKIRQMKEEPEKFKPRQISSYKVEFHKKFSMPFASFFFSLLAVPLALVFGKTNGQTIGLIIGILISVGYWSMLMLGQMFGIRNGWNAFWTMWLPDFLPGVVGLFLYLCLVRK